MVYNELKLSEKLNDTLSMVRSEVMQLRGDLEDSELRRKDTEI